VLDGGAVTSGVLMDRGRDTARPLNSKWCRAARASGLVDEKACCRCDRPCRAVLYTVHHSGFRLDLSHRCDRLLQLATALAGRTAMNFVLLIGFLSLSACAVFVTLRSSWAGNTTDAANRI
jgi:hypothetical protein